MKNILSKIVLGICLLASVSCSDQFLEDKRDYNNMVPIDIYSDPVQANAVFATVYKQILESYVSPMNGADPLMRQDNAAGGFQYYLTEEVPSGYLSSNIVGDNRFNADNSKQSKSGNHIANPPYWNQPRSNTNANNGYNTWASKTLFPTVYVINNFITEIDRTGRSAYVNDTFWDKLKGQAIFARAWLYFDGLRLYGGAPFYSTETEQAEPGDRSTRMSVPESIEKICADFEAASKLLPAKWDAENEGRFTSVAALAMISRVRLYAASPVFNASWDDQGSQRWQLALEASLAAEQAAKNAGYGTSIVDINSWDRSFYGYNGTFNPEAIIKIPKSDKTSAGTFSKWEGFIRPGVVAQSTGGGLPAPDQMLTRFPMKNGKRATMENGYNDEKFYRDRDPRFYKTFAFSGCEWPGVGKQIWLFAYKKNNTEYRYTDGSAGDGGAQKKSRAIVWKMSDPTVPRQSESTAGTDLMEYRYAEILLNIAECYAAQGNAGSCTNYLRQIRNRVGAGTDDLAALSGRYALIEAVLNERAVELAYEGKRPWDMRRWLLYEGGAGFDPRLVGIDANNIYDSESAYGSGWKLYNGTNGRENYTKINNVLTKLGLPRFSGTRHDSKIWVYDINNTYNIDPYGSDKDKDVFYPLHDNALLLAVTPIKKDMSEVDRNTAFDKLEAFYQNSNMQTVSPRQAMGGQYAMDSGTNAKQQGFLFAWRGWYYVYPLHYDMYTEGKGNDWIAQTEGWMIANANPTGTSSAEQDGTYIYCTPE